MSIPIYADSEILSGLREAIHLIVTANPVLVDVTERTLRLGLVSTAFGALVGIPCGCLLGLAASRSSRLLLGAAVALTRMPPVLAGVIVYLLIKEESFWGGGPLAGVKPWDGAYLAQALLVAPVVMTLTAIAVANVPHELLDQARAYGAGLRSRAALALRESRRRVIAGVIAGLAVAMTSVGALAIGTGGANQMVETSPGVVTSEPYSLALGALDSYNLQQEADPGAGPIVVHEANGQTHLQARDPARYLAVSYATVLIGLFFLVAGALTWLQQRQKPVLAGVLS